MFRAKDDAADLDELILDRLEPGRYLIEAFSLRDGSVALIHCTASPVRPPRWAEFLRNIVNPLQLRSASSSAVIAFQRAGRWYFVTFGYGRYHLNMDLMEPGFGLRATLNGIDPNLIRSIDRKRVDTVSRLTREQLSHDSRMGSFGIDVQQDLLSAVTGVPTNARLGTRMYGRDAVGVRVIIEPQDLGSLADELEALYQAGDYRERYPWVDNIAEVTAASERLRLDRALVAQLQADVDARMDLAPPEIVDWAVAEGFLLPGADDLEAELSLDDYFRLVRPPNAISVEALSSDKIQLHDGDGNRIGTWSVYRCLAGEIQFEGQPYVINDGRWYRVAGDFLADIDDSVANLRGELVALPPYTPDDHNEKAYNERVAAASEHELVCMDEDFIWPRMWQDRIEFCDLYRADHTMIHVKRYRGGSKAMSHLFAQAEVSIRCLLSDRAFRAEVDTRELGSKGV